MIQKDFEEVKVIIEENIMQLVQEYGIKLLYIFGSYAKGNNNKSSDIDIAVLLHDIYKPIDKLSLLGDLTRIFNRNDIDLVILNDASPVLRHQIIKYGKVIYEDVTETRVLFEARVLSVYMDMEPFRRTQMEYVNNWLEENTGGDKK